MLTVGIVNHDLATYLPRAIESALEVTPHVVVVDDASTDESLLICDSYPVRVITHEVNSGSAVQGWNELIDSCADDWLVLLSADDELMPWAGEVIAEEGHNADWLWGDLEVIDEDSRPLELWNYAIGFPRTVEGCLDYIASRLSLYPTMIAAFRVSFLREHDLRAIEFEHKGSADLATGLTWLRANPRLKYVPRTFARYRRRADSETFTTDREQIQADLLKMLGG